MDGDPVTREPSPSDDPPVSITLTEMFTDLCPYYISMGMTYEQYWNSNTKVHKAYRKAWEQTKRYRNWEFWMQARYFYDVMLRVAPIIRTTFGKGTVKAGEYLEEPYALTMKDLREREERDRIEKYRRMRTKLMAEAKREVQREAEEAKEQEVSEHADN